MSDDDIAAAALSDPDNPPLNTDELAWIAAAFHINAARLRDLEQGRTRADSALLAYLAVIDQGRIRLGGLSVAS